MSNTNTSNTDTFLRQQAELDQRRASESTMADVMRELATMRHLLNVQTEEIKLLYGQHNQTQNDVNKLYGFFHRQMAEDELRSGLLIEPEKLSLLEVQIWHKETLTSKERQARHTNWSLKLEPSVNGRRLTGKIDVALYSPEEFAEQVSKKADIPEILQAAVNACRDQPNALLGMFNLKTRGKGTPRSSQQFAILRDHLDQRPRLQVWVGEYLVNIDEWQPGKGTKITRAKWYGTWTPPRSQQGAVRT